MNITYANKQLDSIRKVAEELRNLYYSKEKDDDKIKTCYNHLMDLIADYVDYLHKVDVPFKNSYISKWIEEEENSRLFADVRDYLDNI